MLDPQACGDQVCLAVAEVINIAYYITVTEERNLDLERCPYIKERNE